MYIRDGIFTEAMHYTRAVQLLSGWGPHAPQTMLVGTAYCANHTTGDHGLLGHRLSGCPLLTPKALYTHISLASSLTSLTSPYPVGGAESGSQSRLQLLLQPEQWGQRWMGRSLGLQLNSSWAACHLQATGWPALYTI